LSALRQTQFYSGVIPAKAGVDFLSWNRIKMDSRFRGNDDLLGSAGLHC